MFYEAILSSLPNQICYFLEKIQARKDAKEMLRKDRDELSFALFAREQAKQLCALCVQ